MNDSNILDKIIKSQEDQRKSELNPQELVNFLLGDLNSREKEVIKARYGLDREDRQTLESIGQKFGITRERVRQIEYNALNKALKVKDAEEKLADLLALALKYIHKAGYVRLEQILFDELLEDSHEEEIDKNCLSFIFSKFLSDYIEPIEIVHTEKAWRVKDKDLSHFDYLIGGIKNILTKKNKPMHLGEIVSELGQEIDEKTRKLTQQVENWEEAVNSYLEVSKHFKKDLFDKWGLISWRLVNPKRMRDKIYLVLIKYKEPLHYKVIAEKINKEEFDGKRAHSATIHNELILDNRFVLVGRGIYALLEWGYKPGVIGDVVREVLEEAGVPLTKEEVTKEVLKRRIVKEGSVNLVLSDKTVFERLGDGRYQLRVNG